MQGFRIPIPGNEEYEEYVLWQRMRTAVLRNEFNVLRSNDLSHRLMCLKADKEDPGAKVTMVMVNRLDLKVTK